MHRANGWSVLAGEDNLVFCPVSLFCETQFHRLTECVLKITIFLSQPLLKSQEFSPLASPLSVQGNTAFLCLIRLSAWDKVYVPEAL